MPWPGYDEAPPVVLESHRPGRYRARPEPRYAQPAQLVYGPEGQQYLLPGGGHHFHGRSSSMSGAPPQPQVIIQNEIRGEVEDFQDGRRPRSVHYWDQNYDYESYRRRSVSRPRPTAGSPSHEDFELRERLRILRELEKSKEDEEKQRRLEEKFYADKAEEEDRAKRQREKFLIDKAEEEERQKRQLEKYLLDRSEKEQQAKVIKEKVLADQAKKEAEEEDRLRQYRDKFLADKEKKEKEEAETEKRWREKILLEEAKKEAKEAERKKEEKELKERAVEEYKKKANEQKEKEKKEKEEDDERIRKRLREMGWTETQIERSFEKGEKGDQRGSSSGELLALNRPTYIRVRRKHLDPKTLDNYGLPWEWDPADDSFIIIKQWIGRQEQEILFEHTRKLQETKQLAYATTELRKERDQLLVIKKKEKEPRRKSPSRSWIFT